MNLSEDQFAARVRTLQIIVAALVCGVVTLAVVALIIVNERGPAGRPQGPDGWPLISIMALVMLGVNVPLSVVLPGVLLRSAVQSIAAGKGNVATGPASELLTTDDGRLLAARQTTQIVASALLEAAGLFAGIAYLLEGQAFALGALAAVVLLMLWQFPTREGMRLWLERHLGIVAELRQLGGPFGTS